MQFYQLLSLLVCKCNEGPNTLLLSHKEKSSSSKLDANMLLSTPVSVNKATVSVLKDKISKENSELNVTHLEDVNAKYQMPLPATIANKVQKDMKDMPKIAKVPGIISYDAPVNYQGKFAYETYADI